MIDANNAQLAACLLADVGVDLIVRGGDEYCIEGVYEATVSSDIPGLPMKYRL